MPVDEAAWRSVSSPGGILELDDFVTKPSAHPLCYLICYMLKNGDEFIPLTGLHHVRRFNNFSRTPTWFGPARGIFSQTPSTNFTPAVKRNIWVYLEKL